MQDPISDMLTRIRNAQMAKKVLVSMPFSSKKIAIAQILFEEGYILSFSKDIEFNKSILNIELKYFNGRSVIETINRISRPGLRIYKSANKLLKVNGGLGISIISTSQGLMSDRVARVKNIGGEVICNVF